MAQPSTVATVELHQSISDSTESNALAQQEEDQEVVVTPKPKSAVVYDEGKKIKASVINSPWGIAGCIVAALVLTIVGVALAVRRHRLVQEFEHGRNDQWL